MASRSKPSGLRQQVLAVTAFSLTVSIAVGVLLFAIHARQSVSVELRTALSGAERMAAASPADQWPRLVSVFDDNRHVRAVLLDPTGAVAARSRTFRPDSQPPAWFARLFAPDLASRTFVAADGTRLRLAAEADNEVGEVWSDCVDGAVILLLFVVVVPILLNATLARALAPIEGVLAGYASISGGDYGPVAATGSREMRRLAEGFNAMAARLADLDRANRQLQAQIGALQEEERAEIARDLHDEIGPYLFAIKIDIAAVRRLAGSTPGIGARLDEIETAVAHMQAQVRDLLGRLRPVRPAELGLRLAVEDLIDFWRARRPDIAFDLTFDLEEAALSDQAHDCLYRVVQEGLVNAIRHGQPGAIAITLAPAADGQVLARVTDDGRGGEDRTPGFGLTGMRERVRALDGRLTIQSGQGWSVAATLPMGGVA